MAPIRTYSNWASRYVGEPEPIEPFKRYFILCEGANTEKWYFEKWIDLRKEASSHSPIEVIYLEKTGVDRDISFPGRLIEMANQYKKDPSTGFDDERDQIIAVFDADIFEDRSARYDDIVKQAEDSNISLAVTNPSFELFLLLHYENSYQKIIYPNASKILKNEKEGAKRYISVKLTNISGINAKSNYRIGDLAKNVDIAIAQEINLNQDIHKCKGNLTSNVGQIIKKIQDEEVSIAARLRVMSGVKEN